MRSKIVQKVIHEKNLNQKVFYDSVTVSDFPLRGKPRKFNIRRRKWLVKQEGKIVSKKYKYIFWVCEKLKSLPLFLKRT